MADLAQRLAQRDFLSSEMLRVAPLPLTAENFPHGFDMQIRSEGRATRFIRITPEQFQQIENVLWEGIHR